MQQLIQTHPQAGAVEPPPVIIQRTVVRGRNGRPVVVERKVQVGASSSVANKPVRSGREAVEVPARPARGKGATKAAPPAKASTVKKQR